MEQEFIAGRKKFRLNDYNLLRRADEKRQSLDLEQSLSGEDGVMNGMPDFVQTAYATLLKSSNKQDKIVFGEKLTNVAIEFWATEKIRSRFFAPVMGATLSKFQMTRQGNDEDPEILLTFTAVFPAMLELHTWAYDHKTAEFWAIFEPQQGELPLEEGESEEDEE